MSSSEMPGVAVELGSPSCAPSVQYSNPSRTVLPAYADRSAVRSTHDSPVETPVMPSPKFCPFGLSFVERLVWTVSK